MQLALRADTVDVDVPSVRSSTPSRSTRYMVAGLAAATAGVLAINPVTPTPAPLAAEVQQLTVELSAAVNPLVTLQETLTKTLTNLSTLGTGIPAAQTALLGSLTNPAIIAEFTELITANATNPLPLLSALQNFPIGRITDALASSQAILNTNLQNFPTIVQNTLGYLQTGQFVEAFSEVNIYVLVQLLERPGGPLFPIFSIPGDTLASIPGGGVLANLADAILTRGIATGLTRALLVAPITAALFIAETLDHVQASFKAGDAAGALSELISAPIGFVDAFLNGYVPDFPTRSPFQGLLSPNGFFDYFLVDVPNAIATALNLPPQAPPVTAPAQARIASAEPTDLGISTDTTLLKVDSAASEADSTENVEAVEAEPVVETTPAAEPAPVVETAAAGGDTTPAADVDEDDDTTGGSTDADDDDDDASGGTTTGGTTGGSTTGGSTTGGTTAGGTTSGGTTGGGSTTGAGTSGGDTGGSNGGGDSSGSGSGGGTE